MAPIHLLLVYMFGTALAVEDEWWKTSIMYQVYPRSFADSDGDGNGDLTGIKNHVKYLKELGVGIVWVSPIYKSPFKDAGYDVSDFKDVNPLFGTVEDAKALIKEFHDNGLKFFMDMVPNHSSEEHPWFTASRASKLGDMADFYVWKDGNKGTPPNSWISAFEPGDSAWTYDDTRGQYYLHMFGTFQPDLNFRNPKVVDAIFDSMKFWLDLGVDGFRMDAVPFLVEDDQLRDEPKRDGCTGWDCYDHIYTQNQEGTYKVLQTLVDRINAQNYTSTKYLFYEVYANSTMTMKYYYKNSSPFNFHLIEDINLHSNAKTLKDVVDSYMKDVSNVTWPNWVIGNHDQPRIGTRWGADFIDAANMLVLLLPGASVTFQGEELGMTNGFIDSKIVRDCCGRDGERTPMQWNSSDNAGFSTNSNTWLPVNPNYWTVNVESEKNDAYSHYSLYRRMADLRKELVNSLEIKTNTIGDWVFCFTRKASKTYYIVINMNNVEETVVINKCFSDVPSTVSVHTPTGNVGFKISDKIDTTAKVTLRPRSGMVLDTSLSGASSLVASFTVIIASIAMTLFKRE